MCVCVCVLGKISCIFWVLRLCVLGVNFDVCLCVFWVIF